MSKELQKLNSEETLSEKALRSFGMAFLICFGLIIFFIIFLAIFMKGVIAGWF